MKLVILDAYTTNPGDLSWDGLQALADCAIYDRSLPEQVVPRAADADMVLTNKTILDREVLAALPKLRYLGVLATGYNIVALPLAAGVLAPIGVELSPAAGAALMAISTILVAVNAQTLRRVRL